MENCQIVSQFPPIVFGRNVHLFVFFLRGLYTVNHTKPPLNVVLESLSNGYPDPGHFIELLYHRRAGVSDTKGAGSLPVFIAGWAEW